MTRRTHALIGLPARLCIVGITPIALSRITLITAARLHQKPRRFASATGTHLRRTPWRKWVKARQNGANGPHQPALFSEGVLRRVRGDQLGGMMMLLRGLLCGCLFGGVAFVGMGAEAATLERKGPVLVNYGSGYVAAKNGAALQAGDTVMAKPGGRGQIAYDDGCREPVEPQRLVLVQDLSPCVDGAHPWPIYKMGAAAVVAGSLLVSGDKDRAASP